MAAAIFYSHNTDYALELLTAARLNGQDVKALTINNLVQAQALQEAGAQVITVTSVDDITVDTNAIAELLKQIASQVAADTIFLSSDRRGKEIAGRVAQKMNAGCVTDIKGLTVDEQLICERNSLGGATVTLQSISSDKKVMAISPKTFPAAQPAAGGAITEFIPEGISASVLATEKIIKKSDNANIAEADRLIAVGCGIQNEANLFLVEDIARKMAATIGCSKPVATDWKWLPEDRIIGLSGTICKPEVALILGVSGQVQFSVGIRGSRVIVSINKDENAPINVMADYFLVADLNDILPDLLTALS